jgi:RNA polymerase sigma factor (sigma-70 family)
LEPRRYERGAVEGSGADAERADSGPDDAVAIFISMRPRLLAIARRILASTCDAEDVVQEIWLRWQKANRETVANPQALLATMTSRLAINIRQSARRRHEICVESCESEAGDPSADPAIRAERGEAIEQAVLLILGRLTPKERAAYVLREAFGYSYEQVSEVLDLGTANTRQLVSRARRHITADERTTGTTASHQRFLRAFLAAARAGDFGDLEQMLVADLAG